MCSNRLREAMTTAIQKQQGGGTPTPVSTDAQGRQLYPDGTANLHSGPGYQDSMKIGSGEQTGGLKGDTQLTLAKPGSEGKGREWGPSGGSATLNY